MLLPVDRGARIGTACRASTSSPRATTRCGGSGSTTSTSTRSTVSTTKPRWRKHSRRSTPSSAPAKCATSARAAWRPGSSPTMLFLRGRERLSSLRLDAEPLQPRLSRGGARDDPSVSSTQGVGLIPWSPLARGFLAGNRAARGRRARRAERKDDPFADDMYFRDEDFGRRRRASSKSRASSAETRAGGARLAPVDSGRRRSHRRHDEDRTARRACARPSRSSSTKRSSRVSRSRTDRTRCWATASAAHATSELGAPRRRLLLEAHVPLDPEPASPRPRSPWEWCRGETTGLPSPCCCVR